MVGFYMNQKYTNAIKYTMLACEMENSNGCHSAGKIARDYEKNESKAKDI